MANTPQYDSAAMDLIQQVERQFPDLPQSGQDELNLYKAYIANDKIESFQQFYKIYQRDPKDIFTNTAMAVLSLEGLNHVDMTISVLEEINDNYISLDDPFYKQHRLPLLARAYLKKGRYRKALNALDQIPKNRSSGSNDIYPKGKGPRQNGK